MVAPSCGYSEEWARSTWSGSSFASKPTFLVFARHNTISASLFILKLASWVYISLDRGSEVLGKRESSPEVSQICKFIADLPTVVCCSVSLFTRS
ncbi:hypothetical protein PHET_09888 [Paragonimus heterotremus]|uniref:Uncharacterized protein n=1 Tax=Paragonimus heterotremus TaxID=100268 RepID=A0A8J4WE83_9TREM|nr:hypothetical protein PHET_09888 [Paragonimus heterotremus]